MILLNKDCIYLASHEIGWWIQNKHIKLGMHNIKLRNKYLWFY